MPTDPRVDAYIAKAADFAKPILIHLRETVHKAYPDIEETLKWGMPSFMHKGIVCGMAAFKAHCTFGFWKHSLLVDKSNPDANKDEEAMGNFGRITSLKDLPSKKELMALVKRAVKLNEDGVKPPVREKWKKAPLVVPKELTAALKKNKKAQATFDAFSYSHKKEYAEWIAEAKTEATRDKRLATAIEWLSEGKSRNWKYQNC